MYYGTFRSHKGVATSLRTSRGVLSRLVYQTPHNILLIHIVSHVGDIATGDLATVILLKHYGRMSSWKNT